MIFEFGPCKGLPQRIDRIPIDLGRDPFTILHMCNRTVMGVIHPECPLT